MSIREIVGAGAVIAALSAGFVTIDYFSSKEMRRDTLRLRGTVAAEEEVFRKYGAGGDYTTQGEGIEGAIGAAARRALNFGNEDVAYLVEPTEMRYMTTGGLFFEPREVVVPFTTQRPIPVVSSADIADVNDRVEFDPAYREGLVARLLGRQSQNLVLDTEDTTELYEKPLVNPRGLQLIND